MKVMETQHARGRRQSPLRALLIGGAALTLGAWLPVQYCIGQADVKGPPSDEFRKAEQSFAAKDYRGAAVLFGRLAEQGRDPELRQAALLMEAKCLVNLDEFANADQALRRYLVARPDSPEALYLLGYALEREDKPKESLMIFNKAAAVSAPTANDLKIASLDYVLLQDYHDALHWLQRSLAADATDPETWYFLGRTQMQLGDFVSAENSFRRAIALSPDDFKAYNNLGLSLAAQNRNDEAEAAYRDAVRKQAHTGHPSEQPLLNLGTLLNDHNQSREATEFLKQAVAITPNCVRCHEELSRAYVVLGDDKKGIQELETAVALAPREPRLHYKLGQLYRHAGLTTKAAKEIDESKRLYSSTSK